MSYQEQDGQVIRMKISPQRVEEIVMACKSFRRELERLHQQGEGTRDCSGWPECDCRLAEQIRGIVQVENDWITRGDAMQ
jgi:hypothetical protein